MPGAPVEELLYPPPRWSLIQAVVNSHITRPINLAGCRGRGEKVNNIKLAEKNSLRRTYPAMRCQLSKPEGITEFTNNYFLVKLV